MFAKLLVRFCVACSITFLSASLFAAELSPHKAGYSARIKKGVSLNGEAVRELKALPDGSWLYRFDVDSVIADIRESVVFRWDDHYLVPQKYDYELSGMLIRDREQKAEFNWSQHLAAGKDGKRKWQTQVPARTLDRLGYQLQLVYDIQSGKPEVTYPVLHKGRLDEDTFRVIGEEPIHTVLGQTPAILVEKVREPTKKRKTHLWFAKAHPLLLLKMVQLEDDGEEYEINLQWVEINGKRL